MLLPLNLNGIEPLGSMVCSANTNSVYRKGFTMHVTAKSAIALSFVVAFEIVIMISPFAAFFYAAFNPFLLALNQSSATRWLTAFFLPHMIVPPNELLTVIRITGSAFFLLGLGVFLICALQVYLGKLLKKGPAVQGLYRIIRHPQYAGLALSALGLAIMWPRFLTLALLAIMLFLYYVLASDEERRMVDRFGDDYRRYWQRTGMFFPRLGKKDPTATPAPPRLGAAGGAVFFLLLLGFLVGCGFILRAYTVHALPLQQIDNVDVLTITPEDSEQAQELIPSVLADSTVRLKLQLAGADSGHHRILAYFIPIDYVMQGMIANTGDEWKLFEHHKTIGMITDYILHPFAHLTGGHAHHMMEGMKHGPEMYALSMMKRRIIFLDVSGTELRSPYDDFGINVNRTPLFFADVHLHTAEIMQVKDTLPGSGWGTVPTPMF